MDMESLIGELDEICAAAVRDVLTDLRGRPDVRDGRKILIAMTFRPGDQPKALDLKVEISVELPAAAGGGRSADEAGPHGTVPCGTG